MFLVSEDISDLEIDISEDDISKMSKYDWKVYVYGKVETESTAKIVRRKFYKNVKPSILGMKH